MSVQSKTTLKTYFETGDTPTEAEFIDLIDSLATDAQGTAADAALPKSGGEMSGNITMASTETVDGRDLSVDGTKLDGIEALADVTDATNVNAVESDPIVGAINGIVKANGAGVIAVAVADTDYQDVLAEGAFADGDKTKLDGIATGATVGATSQVDGTYGIEATAEGATAGNARGENSVDLCTKRSNAAYVPSGICSMNAAGEDNGGSGTHSLISGKNNHTNTGNYCSISGYYNHTNSGYHCITSGRNNHTNTGWYCSISGRNNYQNSGNYCSISGYNNHTNTGTHCSISGSYNYSNSGNYCNISGQYNYTNSGTHCSISGRLNSGNSGTHCNISGNNNANNTGNYCSISGKNNYSNSGRYCSISGKYNYSNIGYGCSISGKYNYSNSGTYTSISGKYNNSNTGNYCNISGNQNMSNSGKYCLISGYNASSNALDYARVHGGDTYARIIDLVAKCSTANTTPKAITLGGAAEGAAGSIIIPADTAWAFTVHVVAIDVTNGFANSGKFSFDGLVLNDGGTVTVSSATLGTDATQGTFTGSVALSADATNDALRIMATGISTDTIRWTAQVNLTQVD